MPETRQIARLIAPQLVIEGAGVLLLRSIAPRSSNEFDPFLLFDHFAFNNPIEGPLRGFPMHPHRGIETVTYMLNGSTFHRDSLGNADLIGPGDIQWMTSGRGILHEEMPRRGPDGKVFGFQLWVNLPARLKMTEPRYQGVRAENIPTWQKNGIFLRVIAGTAEGITGPVREIAASPLYLDVRLDPGNEWIHPIPSTHTALAYVFEGEALFDQTRVTATHLIHFSEGEQIRVRTEHSAVRFVLFAGAPFKETIVPFGPFVMNTVEEIQQTLRELREGTFIRQTTP